MAEGLLPYLPGAAHDALFASIDALSVDGSRVALDGFCAGDRFARFSALRDKHFGGKPFGDIDVTPLFYTDARVEPAVWLGDHHWDVRGSSLAELAATYRIPVPTLPDELSDLMRTTAYLAATKDTRERADLS